VRAAYRVGGHAIGASQVFRFYPRDAMLARVFATATCKLAVQLTTPLLLRKPCKLFASVARVCQRQLGFLVIGLEAH